MSNRPPPPFAIALIGSSGGGTATLGHTNPSQLLQIIQTQLTRIHANLHLAYLIAVDGGMDHANPNVDRATLHSFQDGRAQILKTDATLQQVNDYCSQTLQADQILSKAIHNGSIHGLICVSCHVPLFPKTLQAAADCNLPVTSSGGTSLSQAAAKHSIRLVGAAGGSVATNSYTRAVSYTSAFAKEWNQHYIPQPQQKSVAASWTSVLNSCLPAFWGVCLTKRLLTLLPFDVASTEQIHNALSGWVLPMTCSVLMATSQNSMSNTTGLIMASLIAATVCFQSILGGLLAGWLVAKLEDFLVLQFLLHWNVPATMMNLVLGGGTGGLVALCLAWWIPFLQSVSSWIRVCIQSVATTNWSFVMGCLCCYGSKVGWYHSIWLPLILIEMELGDASVLGAVDELSLVLVSAGICAGNLLFRRDVGLCQRGFAINLLCGDFVEVCYPYMERSKWINVGGYLGSGLSCWYLFVSSDGPTGSLAYLPLAVSIWLAGEGWYSMMIASGIAMAIPFAMTVLSNVLSSQTRT